jgi:threonylcarbamoyladenosine tRNA methylthiotransferase MtaB
LISEKKKRAFYESQLNQLQRPVLWEAQEEEGFMSGFTDNYVRVITTFRGDFDNYNL